MNKPTPHPQGEPETTAPVPHAGPGGRIQVERHAR
jgi:hypothetical protein